MRVCVCVCVCVVCLCVCVVRSEREEEERRAAAEKMATRWREGLGEWELEALMSFVQVREGAAGPAYYGIVASGPIQLNGCWIFDQPWNMNARPATIRNSSNPTEIAVPCELTAKYLRILILLPSLLA